MKLLKAMIGIKSRINSFVMVLATNVIKARESSKTLITNMTLVIRVDIKIAIIVCGIYILLIYIMLKTGYLLDVSCDIKPVETVKAAKEASNLYELIIEYEGEPPRSKWIGIGIMIGVIVLSLHFAGDMMQSYDIENSSESEKIWKEWKNNLR